MEGNITRDLALLWPHVHDISVSALAAAVVTLGIVILLELHSVVRLRHSVDSNLARVFEQLDLLRFESQQLIEGQHAIHTRAQAGELAPSWQPAVAQPAAARTATDADLSAIRALAGSGVPTREIAERYGLATGEARLLSSLAQARARRAETARVAADADA